LRFQTDLRWEPQKSEKKPFCHRKNRILDSSAAGKIFRVKKDFQKYKKTLYKLSEPG
jgi:hypothetical protein